MGTFQKYYVLIDNVEQGGVRYLYLLEYNKWDWTLYFHDSSKNGLNSNVIWAKLSDSTIRISRKDLDTIGNIYNFPVNLLNRNLN